jgi:hypothetical protein
LLTNVNENESEGNNTMKHKIRDIPNPAVISIIFGRTITYVGWSLFSFLMIFAWAFGGNSDTSFIHFTGESQFTKGHVVEVEETNMEINERSVWANFYEYHDAFGNEYEGEAFTTGTFMQVNEEVIVEYPTNSPQYGRIPETRSAEFNSWLLLTWILPLIGLSLVYIGIRRGFDDFKLLKTGEIANAKLINKEATNTTVNYQRVFKLTFEYQTRDKKSYRKVIKSHKTEHLEDNEFERLLYDPKKPDRSTLVDDISGSPMIDNYGRLNSIVSSPVKPIIFPLFCVMPHLWYFIWYFI